MISDRFRRFFSQRYTPQFRHVLPGRMDEMRMREGLKQKTIADFRMLKRWLLLKLSWQSRLLSDRLPSAPARLLWVRNPRSASIGDSVMELAGRTMLKNYEVDLLTAKSVASLFQTDHFFKKVFTAPESIDASNYDFCLLELFSSQSIKLKRQICPDMPFAGLQGFFYGATYHQMLFNCYRIHHLLGYPYSECELAPFLRPRLFLEDEPSPLPPKKKFRACLVLGGVNPIKTYKSWPAVIRLLRQRWPAQKTFLEMMLIGSDNGQAYVEQVMDALDRDQARSFVGKLSLRATARLIADCDFFIGPDGGLMHCAVAADVPGLALFPTNDPQLFLPPETKMEALWGTTEDINTINPELIAKKLEEQIGLALCHYK